MDPVCHTLVGVALAETGLKRRTPGGALTLLIGANLPDVDILSYAWGSLTALTFRRGWTHGAPAMFVLPLLLAAAVFWLRRLPVPRRARQPAVFGQLALLSYASMLTHPVLDTLNTYGMRWLMPFRDGWFYGDTLFIVDPWLWGLLAAGVMLARRRGTGRPAHAALGLALAYILAMWSGSVMARRDVRSRVAAEDGKNGRIMVSPVPLNSLARLILVDEGGRYRLGWYRWVGGPRLEWYGELEKNDGDPAAREAAQTEEGAAFLTWARFPFFIRQRTRAGDVVHIVDARYTVDPEAPFGALTVRLPRVGEEDQNTSGR
ncbi:MAG: metal-dependent hydrolase [Gemmatimonadetes bacterium]|nr:metal-dependent hydrolase [Gemmatimonadota bacterium]